MNTREIFGDPYNGSICGIVKLYLYGWLSRYSLQGRCEITYIQAMRKACYRAYSIVHLLFPCTEKIIFNRVVRIVTNDQTSAFVGKI